MFGLAASLALSVLVLIGWMLRDARGQAREAAVEQAASFAAALGDGVELVARRQDLALLTALAHLVPARTAGGGRPAAMPPRNLGNIVLLDRAGLVLDASPGLAPIGVPRVGGDWSGCACFRVHRDDAAAGLYLGPPVPISGTAVWGMRLSRRVSLPDGSFDGVVVTMLRLDHLSRVFAHTHLQPGATIALLHTGGALVLRSSAAGGLETGGVAPAAVLRAAARRAGGDLTYVDSVDHGRKLAVYRRIGGWPLVVLVSQPLRAVYADWWHMLGIVLLSATGLGCIVALLARLLRRQHRQRLMAERDMRQSEGKFRAYFEQCAEGILVVRADPAGRFVHEDVNAAAAAILGVEPAAAIGCTPSQLWPPGRARFIEQHLRRCLEGEAIGTVELPPGPRKLRLTLAAVRQEAGQDRRLICSLLDVTDRDRLEDQLRHAQQMEAIGRLTAGVAHDFNNLLQALTGSLELLIDEVADLPTAREYAEITLRSAERGAQLTHHLLAFARKQVLLPRPVELPELLSGFCAVLRRALGPRFQIEVDCAPGLPPAFADPAQIDVALLNLTLNARDAMPTGGTLRVTARAARAPAAGAPPGLAAGTYLVVSVADPGTGMTAEVRARAVEPFFTTKGVKGSGLGLSMVHGFARQSGGDVRIVSSPGRGTTIEMWLPPVAPPAVDAVVLPSPPGRAGRVLLVDDSSDVLLTAGAFLEGAGYQVVRAESGARALALLAGAEAFDVLVTDYAMPGLNGAELIREALRLRADLPALIITGFAEVDGLPLDIHTLRKPFRREELLRALQQLADHTTAG